MITYILEKKSNLFEGRIYGNVELALFFDKQRAKVVRLNNLKGTSQCQKHLENL